MRIIRCDVKIVRSLRFVSAPVNQFPVGLDCMAYHISLWLINIIAGCRPSAGHRSAASARHMWTLTWQKARQRECMEKSNFPTQSMCDVMCDF